MAGKKGTWTRRALLISGGLLGGGLLLGVTAVGGATGYLSLHDRRAYQAGGLDDEAAGPLVNLWLRISPDNRITLISPHTEMGQGAQTGLLQIVADELDADWDQCDVETAPALPEFANGSLARGFLMGDAVLSGWFDKLVESGGFILAEMMELQITGGSMSIRATGWSALRHTAASTRMLMVETAAAELGVAVAELTTRSATVHHEASGRSLTYGELADKAATRTIPRGVEPKPPEARRYVGKSMARRDLPDKVFGRPIYGIDEAPEGMLHAAVVPTGPLGVQATRLTNVDEVKARRGVHSAHIVDSAVAVVADNPWRAEQAARALRFETGPNPHAGVTTESLLEAQRAALESDLTTVHDEGDAAGLLDGEGVLEAEYIAPFLSHAPMEPLNATVWTQGEAIHIASGVQAPLQARNTIAKALGIPPERVVLHPRSMGGGFGRRAVYPAVGTDPIIQAARLHLDVGAPIKLTWSREQDTRRGVYRPMVVARLRGRMGDDGLPLAWDGRMYGKMTEPEHFVPKYAIPNVYTGHVDAEPFLPFGFWRSVDASHNAFWIESFLDELAASAGQDPLEMRLKMLADRPRERAVLEAVAKASGWRTGVDGQGRAMGVAIFECFGSIVAEVAEVSVVGSTPRVHRVWVAVDCGVAVNPDSVEAQMQGGVQFGLSAALYGKIDVKDGAVVQSNFHDYRVVRMADAPRVDVTLVPSDGPVGGAGEPGTPPIAPAVGNALAVLGTRHRRLPMLG